ncbi:hypothetical protein BH09PLA1_BH09PLA1_07610 [soil metagenome]
MGRPKAELHVGGRPILAHLLNQFNWPGPTVLVTAPSRRSPPGHELFDREVVDPADAQGPLRGVLTALENLSTSFAILVTVDMPCVDPTHLNFLLDRVRSDVGIVGLMLRRESRIEPFPSIYRAGALEIIRTQFANGERSVAALSDQSRFAVVDMPREWSDSVWTNLNTPDDFCRFIGPNQ